MIKSSQNVKTTMTNEYCAYVLNVGRMQYANFTIPIIRQYCETYGITFYEIKQISDGYPSPHWGKLDVFRIFSNSQHVVGLYVDIDVIIRKNCPNIFDEFTTGLAMTTDLDHNFGKWTELWTHGKDYDFKYYYNTGVILFDKTSICKLLEYIDNVDFKTLKPMGGEQYYFNKWFDQLNIQIRNLDKKWNASSKYSESISKQCFLHYSTPEEKQKLMRCANTKRAYDSCYDLFNSSLVALRSIAVVRRILKYTSPCLVEISRHIPRKCKIILADLGTLKNTENLECTIVPFTEHKGVYWGPPKCDDHAISEIARLRSQGSDYVVFTKAAFWMLEYYSDMARYLEETFVCIRASHGCVIYDLKRPIN